MTWEQRVSDVCERIKAHAVAGLDPRQLHEELARLLTERPVGGKQQEKEKEERDAEG